MAAPSACDVTVPVFALLWLTGDRYSASVKHEGSKRTWKDTSGPAVALRSITSLLAGGIQDFREPLSHAGEAYV